MTTFHLFTDGSCLNNPGPGGAAFCLVEGTTLLDQDVHEETSLTTNNRMEIMGLILGLSALEDHLTQNHIQCATVVLTLDSKYVLDAVFRYFPGWKKKFWAKVKNDDLFKALDAQIMRLERLGITFQENWVKGHANTPGNLQVDGMANNAAQRAKARMEMMGMATRVDPAAEPVQTAQPPMDTPAPTAQPDLANEAPSEAAASQGPTPANLLIAEMMLMVARQPDTSPEKFWTYLQAQRAGLGL